MEVVAELGGAGIGPEGEAHLLLGAPFGMEQQVHEELAGARRAPRRGFNRAVADEDLERTQGLHAQPPARVVGGSRCRGDLR